MTRNNRLRVIDLAGNIATLAGSDNIGDQGPSPAVRLHTPKGLTRDAEGNSWIADAGHHRVRKIFADGTALTVAGIGSAGFSGDGGPATAAQLHFPTHVALGPDGSLWISDTFN
ncbi:MAG: hypothetical protein AAB295_01545, partial [Chloroflexota bacterium]